MAHIGSITITNVTSIIWNTTVDFGDVNEVKITVKAVLAGRDSRGRSKVAGYDIRAEFNVMENDAGGIQNLYNALSGSTVGSFVVTSSLEKFTLTNVQPVAEVLERDGNGQPSKLKVFVDKMVNEMTGIFQEL